MICGSMTPLLLPARFSRFAFGCLASASLIFGPCFAEEQEVETQKSTTSTPADVNDYRTIIAAPPVSRPIRVAIYDGPGVGGSGVENVSKAVASIPGSTVQILGAEEVGAFDHSAFDVIVFPGGSGSKQSAAIGEAGKANVLKFVGDGGGYVGICAGAYLACSGFSWGLGVINAKTVSSKWRRGTDNVDAEMAESGQPLFGEASGLFRVRYVNGPIIQPDSKPELPAYQPVALFRSEVAENGSPVGAMIDSPAAAISTFGKGRVFVSSPHPEATPGLDQLIPRALLWAAGVESESHVSSASKP